MFVNVVAFPKKRTAKMRSYLLLLSLTPLLVLVYPQHCFDDVSCRTLIEFSFRFRVSLKIEILFKRKKKN